MLAVHNMDGEMIIKTGSVIAALLAVLWAIVAPGFEPIITSVTLIVAAVALFVHKPKPESDRHIDDSENNKKIEKIVFEAKTFPGATKESTTINYDSRIKLWELLEYAADIVPKATPSNYGKEWVYQNAETGEIYTNLGSFAREKGYLEEEATSLLHIGLGPETTLKIVKPNAIS